MLFCKASNVLAIIKIEYTLQFFTRPVVILQKVSSLVTVVVSDELEPIVHLNCVEKWILDLVSAKKLHQFIFMVM